MPTYEYDCAACGTQFERRRRMDERHAPLDCPRCGAETAGLRMSRPTVLAAAPTAATMGVCPGSGAPCGCSNAIRN